MSLGSASSMSEAGGGSDMGESIMAVVRPAVQQLDAQVQSTRNSQVILASKIQELCDLLHEIGQDEPYDLDGYKRKLDDSKRRVSSTSKLLQNVHDRLGKLQRDIARSSYSKKQTIQGAAPAPPAR